MRPRRTPSRRGVPRGPTGWQEGTPPGTMQPGKFEDFLVAWQWGACLILDFDAAHDGKSFDHEPFLRPFLRRPRRIRKSAHKRKAAGDHRPIFRYLDLDSSPPGKGVNDSLLALDVRLA